MVQVQYTWTLLQEWRLFYPVLWSSCTQALLAFKAKCLWGFLLPTPDPQDWESLTWGSEFSFLWGEPLWYNYLPVCARLHGSFKIRLYCESPPTVSWLLVFGCKISFLVGSSHFCWWLFICWWWFWCFCEKRWAQILYPTVLSSVPRWLNLSGSFSGDCHQQQCKLAHPHHGPVLVSGESPNKVGTSQIVSLRGMYILHFYSYKMLYIFLCAYYIDLQILSKVISSFIVINYILLLIYLIHTSLYLLIPYCYPAPTLSLSPLVTTHFYLCISSISVLLYSLIFLFLHFTYNWYHNLSFLAWLISLSIILSKSNRVVAYGKISSSFMAEWQYSIVCMCVCIHTPHLYPFICEGGQGCFHNLHTIT